ncbi:MaoC/PaaZ C-terminal domain-containing protein [Cellulomonas sp.]|uniref:MaoC/PaaZ C-terminal domain-containing protein n=1 Tax=Cellulomonas sp. TaxID=40001 RepID=UPI00281123DA|nr:MaoC/PaaZ C-terminal domain-containing protein [Cellulomonas sp.]
MSPVAEAREVVLPAVPRLGGLYARGAAGAARLAVGGGGKRVSRPLPDVVYAVRDLHVDAAHLTAYQRLLGEPGTDALPAGYVHVLAFPVATALMVRDDFPLPLLGMVHLANRVEQRRRLTLGEALAVRAHAEAMRPHARGTQVDLVVEVTGGAGGDVAWRGVSTYLAPGLRLADTGDARAGDADAGDTPASERTPFAPPQPTGSWRLDADTGRRYGAVSGDRNPIHLFALTARPFGFPRAIAHGMYTASRLLADVGPARGEAFAWSVEFVKPVLLPATVAVSTRPADGGGYDLAAWHARTGKPHVLGSVTPLP